MSSDWRPYIRALMYVVQFSDDPGESVDHAIRQVVNKRPAERGAYKAAITEALASKESLSELLPQSHSNESLRRFLAGVLARL